MDSKVDNKLEVKKREWPLKRGGTYHIQHNGVDLNLPSVTTILGETLPKPQLISWAAREAAKVALENPHLSVAEAANAIYKKRDAAGTLGKTVHSWAEAYGNGIPLKIDEIPEDYKKYCEAFLHFIDNNEPEILYTEVIVFNVTHGYAGTADQIGKTRNGKLAIFDYKTGKNTYYDAHLQQVAYANAEYIYTKEKEILPMPKVDEMYLVHLKGNGKSSLVGVDEPFADFLKVVELWKVLKKFEGGGE